MNKKEIQALAEEHGHGSAYLVKKQLADRKAFGKSKRQNFRKT